jgi:hypothetical protein
LAKKWSVSRWCELAVSLRNNGWTVELLEWDTDALSAVMRMCPFVRDARKATLLETIQSMREMQCVVSVDSWTKYVAGWCKIPQVVIVPDLRKGYTPFFRSITADEVAKRWFRGLTVSPTTVLLGLEKRGGVFEYTLPSMESLTVGLLETAVADVSQA